MFILDLADIPVISLDIDSTLHKFLFFLLSSRYVATSSLP